VYDVKQLVGPRVGVMHSAGRLTPEWQQKESVVGVEGIDNTNPHVTYTWHDVDIL